jgi:hypothetical protein
MAPANGAMVRSNDKRSSAREVEVTYHEGYSTGLSRIDSFTSLTF